MLNQRETHMLFLAGVVEDHFVSKQFQMLIYSQNATFNPVESTAILSEVLQNFRFNELIVDVMVYLSLQQLSTANSYITELKS